MEDQNIRHSQADEAPVIQDEVERARQEAENGLKQDERVRQYVIKVIDGMPFRMRPSILLDLNRCAIEGLSAHAGNWRPAAVQIAKSAHNPPESCTVPTHAEDLCDYVNGNWTNRSSIHLAAVTMWRINWIHPFVDGNGRTSRAASYLVLCAHQRSLLPGTLTIPEQIIADRDSYYRALEAADKTFVTGGQINRETTIELENLLGNMLAIQLRTALGSAIIDSA